MLGGGDASMSPKLSAMFDDAQIIISATCELCFGRDGADEGHVAESRHPAPPGKLVVRGLV